MPHSFKSQFWRQSFKFQSWPHWFELQSRPQASVLASELQHQPQLFELQSHLLFSLSVYILARESVAKAHRLSKYCSFVRAIWLSQASVTFVSIKTFNRALQATPVNRKFICFYEFIYSSFAHLQIHLSIELRELKPQKLFCYAVPNYLPPQLNSEGTLIHQKSFSALSHPWWFTLLLALSAAFHLSQDYMSSLSVWLHPITRF